MTLSYPDAIQTVYRYVHIRESLDKERLHRTEMLLEKTGNPHGGKTFLHVAGTKGKGSVCAMLASILTAQGYRVGLYTSPHLHTLRERIQISGQPISETVFCDLVEQFDPIFESVDGTGFPEVMTCIALNYFAEQHVDVAVIEAHVGGRYDATNVITPAVSIITTIDYDHTDLLGHTLQEIATHKAGIIKPGVPVVSAPQPDSVKMVFEDEAKKQSAPLTVLGNDIAFSLHKPSLAGQSITFDSFQTTYTSRLIGAHQGINMALVLAALQQLDLLPVSEKAKHDGLLTVTLGGRLEIINKSPLILLDIAHNQAAAVALRDALQSMFTGERWIIVYGSKANKDVSAILSVLIPTATHVILTQVTDPPTAPPEKLLTIAQDVIDFQEGEIVNRFFIRDNVGNALDLARSLAGNHGHILVTGSLFVVAAVRALLLNIPGEFGSAH